jgi:ABC-2 type transport system ATP-binding protein
VIIINRGRIEASDTPENLANQLRTSGLLRMELKCGSEDPVSYLSGVSGVREVRVISDGEWRSFEIRIEANSDPREQIFRLAVGRKWVIRELSKERATLEDAFVELTHADR